MSIVTVLQKNKINGVDKIESLLLDNDKRCIVLKNSFEVGSKGFYIRTGSEIDLSKIENYDSIKFIHKKTKNETYIVKSLKYKGESYDGILLQLDRSIEELKSFIVKPPSKLVFEEKKYELPQHIKDIQKVYYLDHPFVDKFMDEELVLLKYMKDGISMTIETFVYSPMKIYSKKREVFDTNSIYHQTVSRIPFKANDNKIYFGKIYKGTFYVINVYDKNLKRNLTCKEIFDYCKSFDSNDLYFGFTLKSKTKFYKKSDLKSLLLINNKNYPNDYIIVRNKEGYLLKIKNNFLTRLSLYFRTFPDTDYWFK